ncbi:MAG: putative bifunctional diguanylate cyclase/phosphodiesterase [Verrucomicrobiota bacterium]
MGEAPSTLEEVQKRFLALAENTFDLICELNRDYLFTYASPSYHPILGFRAQDIVGKNFLDFVHPDDQAGIRERLDFFFSNQNPLRFTFRHRHQDGLFLWIEATGKTYALDNGQMHAVFVFRDATEQKQREDRLDFLANHDLLTGLFNRNALYDILSESIEKARSGTPGVLLFMDLDHLKIVNDTVGHTAGDYLIEAISGILQKLIGPDDALVRFAGDEFIIILQGVSLQEGASRAQIICRTISNYRFTRGSQTFQIRASIGVAQIDGQSSGEETISKADAACYSAKHRGGGRVEIFHESNTQIQKLRNESELFNRLRKAMSEQRLALWYQPIHHIESDTTEWHEALLRLQDDDDSWRAPAIFLAAAERFRSIDQIDLHVLQLAFKDLRRTPQLKMSVNLSGQSLGNSEIKNYIIEQMKVGDITPCRLILEITETAFISNLNLAIEFVKELQTLGLCFALDDFGCGFSSLAHLRDIPVDLIKIDGSFIRTINTETLNQSIVKSINDIAHLLGKKTIAEYVSDEAIHAIVQQLGTDYAQGYHIARPQPIDKYILPPKT